MLFFTLPPPAYKHPYIQMNASRPKEGIRYLRRYRAKMALLDSGVEIFRDPNVKDYPPGHLRSVVLLYERLKPLAEKWLVTIPDYPDDYHHKSLWLSDEITNIERSILNVTKAVEEYPSIPWLIPIQGWLDEPETILRSWRQLEAAGIPKRYSYFGLANTCTTKKPSLIVRTARLAKWCIGDAWLHLFGPSVRAIRQLHGVVDSFDSSAWNTGRWRKTTGLDGTIKNRIMMLKRYEAASHGSNEALWPDQRRPN
jgi:hypothetical protein